jgi:chemotaxis protein CheD
MGGAPTIGSIFAERVVVGVGDMAVSSNANVSSALRPALVSGVVAHDPAAQVGGLLHIMLRTRRSRRQGGRQPSCSRTRGCGLPALAVRPEGRRRKLRIFLAGGANVLSGSDFFKIGERNIVAVKAFLHRERLPIVAEELGGLNNRTLHFKINEGTVDVKLPTGTKTIKLA